MKKNEKISGLENIGWVEIILGGLFTLIYFLFLIGPGIGKIQLLLLSVPFPICLWAGIGVIKQKQWGEKGNHVLKPILWIWFLVYLLMSLQTYKVTITVPGSGGPIIVFLSLIPTIVLLVLLITNLQILRLFSAERKDSNKRN